MYENSVGTYTFTSSFLVLQIVVLGHQSPYLLHLGVHLDLVQEVDHDHQMESLTLEQEADPSCQH